MMSGEKSSDGVCKKRNALGDVTNLDRKRGVSLISGNTGINDDKKEKGAQFAKQVCVGVENIEKQNLLNKGVVNDKESGKRACVSLRSCSEINSLRGNVIAGISKIQGQSKEKNLSHGNVQIGRANDVGESAVGESAVDASKDSCVSSISMPTSPCNLDSLDVGVGVGVDSQGEQSNNLHEQFDTSVGMNDENELGDDNLDSSKCESTECFGFPESQESRSSGLERCVGLKGDGFSNSSAGVDLIKACSCSFCAKAAYIWSDLHYQDIKGRLAALKKSQKEANILVQRSCRDKAIDIHGEGKPDILELQSSLMCQWRSLFMHMEGILGRESSQLEASLSTLNDLRESCKTELESLNGRPPEKQ